jgi:hypothetical protein
METEPTAEPVPAPVARLDTKEGEKKFHIVEEFFMVRVIGSPFKVCSNKITPRSMAKVLE